MFGACFIVASFLSPVLVSCCSRPDPKGELFCLCILQESASFCAGSDSNLSLALLSDFWPWCFMQNSFPNENSFGQVSCWSASLPTVRFLGFTRGLSNHPWAMGMGQCVARWTVRIFCFFLPTSAVALGKAALSSVELPGPAAWHSYWCCPRVSLHDLPLGCECGLYQEYPVLTWKSAPGEICPCLGTSEMVEGVLLLWP